jgi:hypothetical protein
LQKFDIFAAAGANAALVESFSTTVTNGALAIEFDSLVQNAKINAIEILPIAGEPLLTLKFSYTDGTGTVVWQISMGVNPADADLSAVQTPRCT